VKGTDVNVVTILSKGREASSERRHARHRLERELAEYRTPAERRELYAILERYPYGETWEILRVLDRQAESATENRLFVGTTGKG
jgi:hypothetical protein